MANRQRQPVSYRPFRTEPLLADGLLAVSRPDGSLLERASQGLFNLAAQANQVADRQQEAAGRLAGQQAALAGRPQAEFEGGSPALDAQPIDDSKSSPNHRARGTRFSATVNDAIDRAAAKYGVSRDTLYRIAQIESGGNPNAKNPASSAGGLFQFVDGTARQYGLADRFDPAQAADAAARLTRDNAARLRRVLGREPTTGELYLAHQQGAGGAEKLLANPDALAASLVGADAVRKNGGTPGMTARQFANMWTRRGDGGHAMARTAADATPSTLKIAGGKWRPSGSDTIYGRAFNEAGTKTYLQMVDTEMRSTTQQIYEKYKDDPVALEKGISDLKGALKKDHIFPEIEADYEIGFDRLAATYLGQARENFTRKMEQQDRAAFLDRTAALETDQQRMLTGFDPKDANAADAIASAQSAVDSHYDDAVGRGLLTPDAAAKAKLESRRNTALAFYGKQADALDADGVKNMRTEMEADFADGGIAGLDGEGFATLKANLEKLEKTKRSEAQRGENDFRERGDKMALRLLAGVDVDPAELSQMMLDAGAAPNGEAVMQETFAKISAGRAIRDMSLPEAEKHVAGLAKQYGKNPTDAQLRTLMFAQKMVADKRQAITTDSVSYAERNGIVPETPLLTDAGTAEEMSATMAARAKSAEQAAVELGVPVRYLKAGEAAALGKIIREKPESGAAIAGAIVAGAGNAAPRVLAEFGKEAPMVAEAGAIVAFGGSQQAAEDVIAGYGNGVDGKQLKGLKPDTARMNFDQVAGNALALARDDRLRIDRAAASIARKRIADEGLDPTSDEALAVHAQAVQEAAGAVYDRGVQFGGFTTVGAGLLSQGSKVLIPSEIRADRFEDVLGAVTDDDLAGLTHPPKAGIGFFMPDQHAIGRRAALGLAATLRGATPVAVDGGFAFAAGDPAGDDPQWIVSDDGKPFVLDLVGMRDRLASRVPGAFR